MFTTALPHAAFALTLGALAFAPGCSFVSPAAFTSVKNVATPAPAVGGIDAETRNGSITIAAGGGGQVSVVATVRAATQERADATVVNVTQQPDGSVSVRVAWPGGSPQSNDGCSLEITVPGPHPALRPLLEAGFRIDYIGTFCASAPVRLNPARYIPSGGDLY